VAQRRRHNPDDPEDWPPKIEEEDPDSERAVDELYDLLTAGPGHPKYGREAMERKRVARARQVAHEERRKHRSKALFDVEYSGTIDVFYALGEFFDWTVRQAAAGAFGPNLSLRHFGMWAGRRRADTTAPDPLVITAWFQQKGTGDDRQEDFWATTVPITETAFGKQWRSHGPMGHLIPAIWTARNKKLAVYRDDPQASMRYNPYVYVDRCDLDHPGDWWVAAHEFIGWLMRQAYPFEQEQIRSRRTQFGWIDLFHVEGTRDTDPHWRFDFYDDDEQLGTGVPVGQVWMVPFRGKWPGTGHIWHRDCAPGDCYPEDDPHGNLRWPDPTFSSRNGRYQFFIDEDPWETVGV
jgi:hypothetical protein